MYLKIGKRVIDIVISIILLIPVSIVIIIFGFAIKMEDTGPILYLSNRLGKDKKIYKMYKLRSMKVNAPDMRNDDGSTYNSDDDPRVLKIGKFIRKASIDELPQIFNVLKGEMSLIGPRPDLEAQKKFYENNKDETRFKVKPGITGYAQCNGRNDVSWNEKLAFDHYYVDNCSFILDIKIIIKTVYTVVLKKGIYANETKEEK